MSTCSLGRVSLMFRRSLSPVVIVWIFQHPSLRAGLFCCLFLFLFSASCRYSGLLVSSTWFWDQSYDNCYFSSGTHVMHSIILRLAWDLYFWKSMLMGKKKRLQLFPLSNILQFTYQIILILKMIASYYKNLTPDCFVNLNLWCIAACDLRDFHK